MLFGGLTCLAEPGVGQEAQSGRPLATIQPKGLAIVAGDLTDTELWHGFW